MNGNSYVDEIIKLMRNRNRIPTQLSEHDDLLFYLYNLFPITGRLDVMYCNAFLSEAIQLLSNSIFLFEDGFFDCAFYSVRQASELIENMLYLSIEDKKVLNKWSAKEHFPMSRGIKEQLKKISSDYNEIKTLIPEYFEHHSKLIKIANKIIHKQGFDTFYCVRNKFLDDNNFPQDKETKLFTDSLKYTIGMVIIIFIILEPISLALSDENIDQKLNFNFLTEPIDIHYFKKYLGLDNIIEGIESSNFYKNFISNFSEYESMSPAVYSVIRDEAWDLDALDEIEKQLDLLGIYERFMFYILKTGIKVSVFYYNRGITWYYTSVRSNFDRKVYGGQEFEKYLKPDDKFNQSCENVYISVITMYKDTLYIEHNELLSKEEIEALKILESESKKEFDEINKVMDNILNK